MSTLQDFLKFLWGVVNNWAGYATGGIIVALVALWFTWRDKPMPRNLGIALAVVFLVLAF